MKGGRRKVASFFCPICRVIKKFFIFEHMDSKIILHLQQLIRELQQENQALKDQVQQLIEKNGSD